MSVSLLSDNYKKPDEKDDLESIMYILIYMAVMYTGPNNMQRLAKDIPKFLQEWFNLDSTELMRSKVGMVHSPDAVFEQLYLCHFTPYFEFLKPGIDYVSVEDRNAAKNHAIIKLDFTASYDSYVGVIISMLPNLAVRA